MAFAPNGTFKLPGFESIFSMTKPIGDATYFTWGEALHFEAGVRGYYRRPESKEVVENILKQAKHLNRFREWLGHPIIVTSWYRDPDTNRRVGGAKRSKHLLGLATDIYVPSKSALWLKGKVNEFGWYGGKGFYSTFVHLDTASNRVWYG